MARQHSAPRRNATRSRAAVGAASPGAASPAPALSASPGASAEYPEFGEFREQVQELRQVVVDTGQEGVVAEALRSALDDVRGSRHPLQAELSVAGTLAAVVEGATRAADEAAGLTAEPAPGSQDSADRVAEGDIAATLWLMVAAAEEDGSDDAAGLLQVLSTLAGGTGAQASAAAAQRLLARGASLPRSAQPAGRPTVVRAWGYVDAREAHDSVTVEFSYGHRRHAVSVLVDHALGGGVKDIWFSQGNDVADLRESLASSTADESILDVIDLTTSEAAARLAAALEQEPCPEEVDQLDDVIDFLPLLRSRVAWMSGAGGAA